MIAYSVLQEWLAQRGHADWANHIQTLIQQRLQPEFHGDFAKWQSALAALPVIEPDSIDLNSAAIRVGHAAQLTPNQRAQLKQQLQLLHPWRKGPFDLFGVYIDTEWRSDWKWDRIVPHITPLTGRTVLDVGCGSGYHCWRMAGAGAQQVIGIEPMLLYVMQFQALQFYLQQPQVQVLPLGTADMPAQLGLFDTVFSMGLLYHQREPHEHLRALQQWLRPGGELVLETLVIDAAHGELLIPAGRYASMRNVWGIPSIDKLLSWMAECGYQHSRCVDVAVTTVQEQRPTAWMTFQSLEHYLDPADNTRTLEGHPAPRRATVIAQSPG